jgi:hypothetical protein
VPGADGRNRPRRTRIMGLPTCRLAMPRCRPGDQGTARHGAGYEATADVVASFMFQSHPSIRDGASSSVMAPVQVGVTRPSGRPYFAADNSPARSGLIGIGQRARPPGLRAGELFARTKDFVQVFAASGKIGQAVAAIY